ncbi:MAG: hypothetical protein JWO46_1385 [Nocardioidaceae bacterium]|nr:hypothetical protein [Nocardioidaceae bacterium]
MSILAVLPLEAESGFFGWPYVIGGIALVILFGGMLGLLAMGKGREHS